MKVFHGSYVAIDKIDLNRCEVGKDFGKGFYVTMYPEQAKIWAIRKGKEKRTESAVTEFEFDDDICRIMKLKVLHFENYNYDWLDFVVLNRKNLKEKQIHDYDIVEGPVANDRINRQIDDYIDGLISNEQFLNELIYYPSHQICFCTIQSLQALSFSKGCVDSAMYHIDSDVILALMRDNNISELKATDIYYTSEIYSKLADETTELYKKQWIDIYQMLKIELQKK
jgi:hypothetical protein